MFGIVSLPFEHETACAGTREPLLEAGLICFVEWGFEVACLRMVANRVDPNTSLGEVSAEALLQTSGSTGNVSQHFDSGCILPGVE
jgi:hypothetical protein